MNANKDKTNYSLPLVGFTASLMHVNGNKDCRANEWDELCEDPFFNKVIPNI